jgi:hypothetical protein
MAKRSALDHLDQIVVEHPHSPASTRIPVTLGELRDLKTRIDRLADMVASAAALQAGELSRQEGEYVEEELRVVAADLEKAGQRYIPASSQRGAR